MTTDQILEKMNSLVWKLFDFHDETSDENEAAAEKASEEVKESLDDNSSDALRALADSLNELFLEMTRLVREEKRVEDEPKGITIGSMVEVIHKSETQKYYRRTIGKLLETTERGVVLSLRPKFGTTDIPIEWVWKATKVSDNVEVIVNERVE